MNKISMDALNTGWCLGFGTAVARPMNDFDLLVARKLETDEVPAQQPRRFAAAFAAVGAVAQDFLTALTRRAAH